MANRAVWRAALAFSVFICGPAAADNFDTIWDQLDSALFRAGEAADVTAAHRLAGEIRARHIKDDIHQGYLAHVDACFAAGKPHVEKAERQAILSDPRIAESYTPNANMRMAEGFANGWGVKADLKRATAFVCHANTVPAELMVQVEALLRHDFTAKKPFLFCSYVTSGMNSGFCAGYAAGLADKVRATQIATLTSGYSDAEKAAFGNLRQAADAYFSAHASLEQDLTGTARGVFITEAETAKKQQFLKDLMAFEAGALPAPDAAQSFAGADRTRNAAYQTLLGHSFDPEAMPGTVTKDGIRKTERAWLEYRDAWLAFARMRHPNAATEPLKIQLTLRRSHELQHDVTSELP